MMDGLSLLLIIVAIPLLLIAVRSNSKKESSHDLFISIMHDGCQHCGGDFKVIGYSNNNIALKCRGCELGYVVNPELKSAIRGEGGHER